jgi:hypothetical protein
MVVRGSDEEDVQKSSDDKNVQQSFGEGIYIPMNGQKVNICEAEYVNIVTQLHSKLKDVLISACTGSSS